MRPPADATGASAADRPMNATKAAGTSSTDDHVTKTIVAAADGGSSQTPWAMTALGLATAGSKLESSIGAANIDASTAGAVDAAGLARGRGTSGEDNSSPVTGSAVGGSAPANSAVASTGTTRFGSAITGEASFHKAGLDSTRTGGSDSGGTVVSVESVVDGGGSGSDGAAADVGRGDAVGPSARGAGASGSNNAGVISARSRRISSVGVIREATDTFRNASLWVAVPARAD